MIVQLVKLYSIILILFQAHNMEVPEVILQNLNIIEEQALQVFIATQCGLAHIR